MPLRNKLDSSVTVKAIDQEDNMTLVQTGTEIIGAICKMILSPITSAIADGAKRFFDGTKAAGTYAATEIGETHRT